jgi:hypothetical protein
MKLSVQLHPTSRTRMKGAVTLFPHMPSWLAPGNFMLFLSVLCTVGTAVAQWLRCCATNRKVAGIFRWNNPSDRTMTLGSTQPLTEMSTRSLTGGKCGRCVGLTSLPPSCAVVVKSGKLNFLEPSGPLQACNGTALPLLSTVCFCIGGWHLDNTTNYC